MPTYEYVCTSCGHRLEVVQSFSDAALTTCPMCQGALRKVFGNVGIVLKGSGFYKTDSRKATSNGSSTRRDGGASSDTKAESKSADSSKSSKDAASSTPKDSAPTTSSSSTSSPEKAPTG